MMESQENRFTVLFSTDASKKTSSKGNRRGVREIDRPEDPDAGILPMKHALFVAYHYPPESSSSGVLRTLKYTRYLGRFGWRVTVLTLNRDAYQETDPRLEEQIPADVRVVRTRFIEVKRHLAIWGRYPS